jgi:hypothetical protein
MHRRKTAAMATSAATCGSMASDAGSHRADAIASVAPSPAPIVKRGASVPPDVPLPSTTLHEASFATVRAAMVPGSSAPAIVASMLS